MILTLMSIIWLKHDACLYQNEFLSVHVYKELLLTVQHMCFFPGFPWTTKGLKTFIVSMLYFYYLCVCVFFCVYTFSFFMADSANYMLHSACVPRKVGKGVHIEKKKIYILYVTFCFGSQKVVSS